MKTVEELMAICNEAKGDLAIRNANNDKTKIVVGMATCGIEAGARDVLNAFVKELADKKIYDVELVQDGGVAVCDNAPVVEVIEDGKDKVIYEKVTPAMVTEIVASHIINGIKD